MEEKEQSKSKMKNKKVVYKGIKFDSEFEQRYYEIEVEPLMNKGYKVELHKRIELLPSTVKEGYKLQSINYEVDYHITAPDRSTRLIDAKGNTTPVFIMKWKMIEHKYPDIKLEIVIEVPKYLQFILSWACDYRIYNEVKKVITKFKKENGFKAMSQNRLTPDLIVKICNIRDGIKVFKNK